MSSGMNLDPEVLTAYNAMKSGRAYKWITMKVNDTYDCIVIDENKPGDKTLKGDKDIDCWNEFISNLDDQKPRYILYDIDNMRKDGNRILQKIVFFSWCPDSCPIKEKMTFASSKEYLVKQLTGIDKGHQATDLGDLDYKELFKILDK